MSRRPTASDYAVLGLPPGAADGDIRAAYRRLAKLHHPDRNPGDAAALATFQRITDSYAALRHRRPATPANPFEAARAARRPASSRRGDVPPAGGLLDLPAGASLWLDGAALMVAPDRTVTLRPDAAASTYPTPDHVIRVERRADGFHLFLPPQPLTRWMVGPRAESEGVTVAEMWVGDRQDDGAAIGGGARLPLRLIGGTVAELAAGERGWVQTSALHRTEDGSWILDLGEPVSPEPHRVTRLRVLRDDDGFRVHSDLPESAFTVLPAGDATGAPVVTAILAGMEYPPAGAG